MKDIGIRIREADLGLEPKVSTITEAATLADLALAARRQYLPVVLCTVLAIVAGLAHYATSPKQYYSQSRVLVDDRMSELAAEITANTAFVRNDTALLNEMQVLQSLQLAIEVSRATEIYKDKTFMNPQSSALGEMIGSAKAWVGQFIPEPALSEDGTEELLSWEQQQTRQILIAALVLQNHVLVDRVGKSFSINIGYVTQDPKLAAIVVNGYANAYMSDHLNANLQASDRTGEWMRTRLEELQASANAAAREAEEFKANNKVSDLQGLRELEQRAFTLTSLHDAIAARYEQIVIEGSYPVANGRILTHGIPSRNAAAPRLWQFLSIAGVIGLIFGTAIATFREYRERFFRTGDDVTKFTGLAFLGYLPTFKAGEIRDRANLTASQNIGGVSSEFVSSRVADAGVADDTTEIGSNQSTVLDNLINEDAAPHLFIPVHEPSSLYSATLRNIHTTFEQGHSGKNGGVIAVSSILPGEGKSALAANYANMVAKFGVRTLLIDTDLHQPSLSTQLRCSNSLGIVQVLDGSCSLTDAICKLPHTGLDFLPGTFEPREFPAGEALYQQSMVKLIAALRSHYDYVILDMPALGFTADIKAVLPGIDKIILTSEWGKTPRSLVRQTMEREPEIARKVMGIVLNRVNVNALGKYSSFGGSERYLKGYSRKSA